MEEVEGKERQSAEPQCRRISHTVLKAYIRNGQFYNPEKQVFGIQIFRKGRQAVGFRPRRIAAGEFPPQKPGQCRAGEASQSLTFPPSG